MDSFKSYVETRYTHPKTIQGYVRDVEDFLAYLTNEAIQPHEVKEVHIKKYQFQLTEGGYSTHTIARKMSALRLFFKHLRKIGKMERNPLEDIKQPIVEKREKKLSTQEAAEIETQIVANKRDQLLFSLLYREKIKLRDIVMLKKESFNEAQSILYLEKRALSVSPTTKTLMMERLVEEGDYMIASQKGKPLTESGAYYIVKNLLRSIGREDLRPIDLTK